MSRSYRRPYSSWCGSESAKHDKRIASRSVRRKSNQTLRTNYFEEDFLMPHRFECNHNDVWGWGRDGKQFLQVPDSKDWSRYLLALMEIFPYNVLYTEWPPKWCTELKRK